MFTIGKSSLFVHDNPDCICKKRAVIFPAIEKHVYAAMLYLTYQREAINNEQFDGFANNVEEVVPIKGQSRRTKSSESPNPFDESVKFAVYNMFARLVLISAVASFVYIRSLEGCESGTSSPLEIPRLDADMNTRSTKTIEQTLLSKATAEAEKAVRTLVAAEKPNNSPRSTEKPTTIHELVHPGAKHPKKRATIRKEERKADLRPGCCG